MSDSPTDNENQESEENEPTPPETEELDNYDDEVAPEDDVDPDYDAEEVDETGDDNNE